MTLEENKEKIETDDMLDGVLGGDGGDQVCSCTLAL